MNIITNIHCILWAFAANGLDTLCHTAPPVNREQGAFTKSSVELIKYSTCTGREQ